MSCKCVNHITHDIFCACNCMFYHLKWTKSHRYLVWLLMLLMILSWIFTIRVILLVLFYNGLCSYIIEDVVFSVRLWRLHQFIAASSGPENYCYIIIMFCIIYILVVAICSVLGGKIVLATSGCINIHAITSSL